MRKFSFWACLALSVLLSAACTPTQNVRGNLLEDYQIAEVVPGQDSQTDVLRKLGSPTTKAPFNENVWYYLGQETEKKGILDPKVTNEKVIVVFFDEAGIVTDLQNVDNQRVAVPYVREKTPTSGNEMTVMQQLLGNIGKFNKAEEPVQ